MDNQFTRLEYFENFEKLKDKTICIVGLGGVGGSALEVLVRSGVSKFIICDFDIVNITNLNRLLASNISCVGISKTEVFNNHILSINPACQITTLNEKFSLKLFDYHFDYLIDAIDDLDSKFILIKECIKRGIPIISSMGTARKINPFKLKVLKISKTSYDPIARIIRKKLRDENISYDFDVVSSEEEVVIKEKGSYIAVTSFAGIILADYIIKKITNNGG